MPKSYENPVISCRAGGYCMNIAERSYLDTKITIVEGDITKFEADAIVNPANSELIMGGGVAGALLRAGGNRIQDEALGKAPVQIGHAVATTAGKLKAKYIIHAPTMTRPAMAASLDNVRAATNGALECARQMRIQSLAFPGLGTGVGGLDPQDAAKAIVEEIKSHIEAGTTIKQIALIGYNSDLAKAFEKATRTLQQSV